MNNINPKTPCFTSSSYNTEEIGNLIDHIVKKTDVPYTIDALIILSFKSLGILYADAIIISAQLELLFPHWARDCRVLEGGFKFYKNYTGQSYLVSEFLVVQVQHCFIRNPEVFTPVHMPNTDLLPHSFSLCSIQSDCKLLQKLTSGPESDTSICFIDSIYQLILKNNLESLSAKEIRQLIIKDHHYLLTRNVAAFYP